MKILRLRQFMWTQRDGTIVPRTHLTWEDDDSRLHASTFEGHLSPDEALYQVQVEAV